LGYVGDAVERFGIRVHGYALMPNHYHLMVESVRGNLSSAMQFVGSRYGQAINEAAETDGSLFRGRFRNRLVHEPSHWRHLLVYLHLNPVKANLVMKPDQAEWTSHGVYVGQDRYPDWLTTSDLKKSLKRVGGYRRYLRDVTTGKRPEPPGFDCVSFEGRLAGQLMLVKHNPVGTGLTPSEALRQVRALTGATNEQLRTPRRGRMGNPARALAAWWLVYGAGLSNARAGALVGMSAGAVSKVMGRMRSTRGALEGKLAEWMFELRHSSETR
jgi:REP element-mobilizing transposase RayT